MRHPKLGHLLLADLAELLAEAREQGRLSVLTSLRALGKDVEAHQFDLEQNFTALCPELPEESLKLLALSFTAGVGRAVNAAEQVSTTVTRPQETAALDFMLRQIFNNARSPEPAAG